MRVGDIYWLRYDNSYGHEMSVGRPVVVLSGDTSKWDTDDPGVVTIAYMTTSPKTLGVNVPVMNRNRKSWVLCNQLGSVDGRRLIELADTLTDSEMEQVREGLLLALGLNAPVVDESEQVKELNAELDRLKNIELELEIQKRMYDRVLNLLVEKRLDRDMRKSVIDDDPQENKVKTKLKPKKLTEVVSQRKVNVNVADWKTIWEITGMSDKTAMNIVKYREKHGRFADLEDLLMVPRFGKGLLMKHYGILEV